MANEETTRIRKDKQQKLPVIRQAEALESLAFLWLHSNAYIQGNDEAHEIELTKRRAYHLKVLMEYALLTGTVEETDVIPF